MISLLLAILSYSSHIALLSILAVCYKKTEEHLWFLIVAVLRILLFGVIAAKPFVSDSYGNALMGIEENVMLAVSVSMLWFSYSRWSVPNRVRKRNLFLAFHGLVWGGVLFSLKRPELLLVPCQIAIISTSFLSAYVILRYKYRNPYLRDIMTVLFRRLTFGILIIYPLVLLFDSFFIPVQLFRPLYDLELPLYNVLDIWVNSMVSYIALKTMFSMPSSGSVHSFENRFRDMVTPRESEVLDLILQGKSNGEIAADLDIAIPTAKKHVANIYRKLGVNTRHELLCRAR